MSRFKTRCVALLAGLCAALSLTGPATAAPAPTAGLVLRSDTAINARLHELVFTTQHLDAPTFVRVLLPQGYSPARRYPVLMLLEGCCNAAPQARDWTDPAKGNAEAIVGGAQVILVMPDSGKGGFYSDWYNNGHGGNPRWESYHIGQLLPWVDAHYSTVPGRRGHAIAGFSMGGFGAMSYAARHPDRFVSAASFSGALDSNDPKAITTDEMLAGLDNPVPGSLWGPRSTQEARWRAHNPWDLAANLRGMHLALYTGNGNPGPFNKTFDATEGNSVHPQSVSMHNRLNALGIAHEWHDYGGGSHTWSYWRRDLSQYLPGMMATFARPPALPDPFAFTAAEPRFDAYGYQVTVNRTGPAFATLSGVTRNGFTLNATTSATVATATRYRAGAPYQVTVTTPRGTRIQTLHATRGGRLTIPITLGAFTTHQPDIDAVLGQRPETATITIAEHI
ncbi:alpha/beta hydrolase [Nocardia macrotermitis]|uniref:Esterase n=1 Tax=Nocardia macrotermitis TaxID=2585198 RepID=A0A7K0CWU4_9NOCA|nr:alpha/beta hydrolase-fold protein [Nocardia macrotermitis]MQY17965.1 hypothetical protein [Nocardia macrotermitis]